MTQPTEERQPAPEAIEGRQPWEAPELTVISTAAHTQGADPMTNTTEAFGYTQVS